MVILRQHPREKYTQGDIQWNIGGYYSTATDCTSIAAASTNQVKQKRKTEWLMPSESFLQHFVHFTF